MPLASLSLISVLGLGGILLLVALMLWLHLLLAGLTGRWFTPHFSIVAEFCFPRWTAEVSCGLARLLD